MTEGLSFSTISFSGHIHFLSRLHPVKVANDKAKGTNSSAAIEKISVVQASLIRVYCWRAVPR